MSQTMGVLINSKQLACFFFTNQCGLGLKTLKFLLITWKWMDTLWTTHVIVSLMCFSSGKQSGAPNVKDTGQTCEGSSVQQG